MTVAITALSAEETRDRLDELADLLRACVEDGASVNFLLPFTAEAARRFWEAKVLPPLMAGGLILLIAEAGGRIAGTVQLDHDTPPNQPHRAEVRKLLVHPDFRRQGIARVLMRDLEARAGAMGRHLLTLDTLTGDKAEPLYTALGYVTVGTIPDYCIRTDGSGLGATTFMYKQLGASAPHA